MDDRLTVATPSTTCPRCGAAREDGDRFCATCGEPLSSPAAAWAGMPPPAVGPGHAGGFAYPPPVVSGKTNGMAIASLVLGILWLWGVGSVLALTFGILGRNQINDSAGTQSGSGMAIAGIVLGIVGIAGAALLLILVAASQSGSG